MGWTSQIFNQLIIDAINQGGLFVYNGTPAKGNLVGSWTAAAGADAYGNAYPLGLTIYGSNSSPVIEMRPDLEAILVYQ